MVQQRHGGEVHPGRVRPLAGMRGMSQRSFGAVAVLTVQQPSVLGRHGSAPGGRRTFAERIEDRGPRLLSAPRRIYLGDRPGEPGPHGQNRSLPRFTYSISTWPDKLLGTHPLNRLLSKSRSSKLPRLPNSGGISSRSDGSR